MSLLYFILGAAILSGIILIFIAAFFIKGDSVKKSHNSQDINFELLEERIKQTANDADDALLQINSLSGQIMEELEDKYKEMLFLYQMVDDKKSEMLSLSSAKKVSNANEISNAKDVSDVKEVSNAKEVSDVKDIVIEDENINSVVKAVTDEIIGAATDKALDSNVKINDELNETGINNNGNNKGNSKSKNARYNYSEIIDSYKEGKTISEIAKKQNIGQSEVKLIINMHKA